MDILFICMSPIKSNSSSMLRNLGCIKGLLELGHTIDTITLEADSGSTSYDDSNSLSLDIKQQYFIRQNAIYRRFRTRKMEQEFSQKSSNNNLRMIIKQLLQGIFIFDLQAINVKNVRLDKAYDLVISSSDPKSSHLLAYYIIKRNGLKCPWYQYWGDPMYDDISLTRGWLKQYRLKYVEHRFISKASRIIYTSPLTYQKQKEIYPDNADKMTYACQACLKWESDLSETGNSSIAIGYFGDYMCKIRNILPLISSVNGKALWKLIIAGRGDVSVKGTNIVIYPRLPYSEIEKLERSVDVLVGICNIRGTQIPAKFYYMAGIQKPVILIVDGENADYLKRYFGKYGRYIVCDNQITAIQEAIQTAIKQIQQKTRYKLPEELLPVNVAKKILGE